MLPGYTPHSVRLVLVKVSAAAADQMHEKYKVEQLDIRRNKGIHLINLESVPLDTVLDVMQKKTVTRQGQAHSGDPDPILSVDFKTMMLLPLIPTIVTDSATAGHGLVPLLWGEHEVLQWFTKYLEPKLLDEAAACIDRCVAVPSSNDAADIERLFNLLVPRRHISDALELQQKEQQLESDRAQLKQALEEVERKRTEQDKTGSLAHSEVPEYWVPTKASCPYIFWKCKKWLQNPDLTHLTCSPPHVTPPFDANKVEIVSVSLNQQGILWNEYKDRQKAMRLRREDDKVDCITTLGSRCQVLPIGGDHLDANLNEVYLFHGTSSAVLDAVLSKGLDYRWAKSASLYGEGVYFTPQFCKAWQYARAAPDGVRYILVCRVTLGYIHETAKTLQGKSCRLKSLKRSCVVTRFSQVMARKRPRSMGSFMSRPT